MPPKQAKRVFSALRERLRQVYLAWTHYGVSISRHVRTLTVSIHDTTLHTAHCTAVVRLHMANESTNGEVFIQPLSSIRHVLERSVSA